MRAMNHRPAASLIIVNYNGADLLPACIESALATLGPHDELLVVDNASTDESRAVVTRYGAVKLVPLPRNTGFGRACNLGVAAARGDMLIFLNPDVTFPCGWLDMLAQAARSDPQIALLCPQTVPPGAPPPDIGGLETTDQAALPGCCLAARRAAWLALGGFDESFFLFWEDTELCWRAWLLGWRVVTARRSWVYHQKSATTAQFGRWDAERMRNSVYTYLKLMRWPVAGAYVARMAAATIVKSVRQPALAPQLARAWMWNIAHLPHTLTARRAVQSRRKGDYRTLERLIRLHGTANQRNTRSSRN
jgi:N-acetylglucosaminyl-diphospho-decaprenol L-rhamnosyltransferase